MTPEEIINQLRVLKVTSAFSPTFFSKTVELIENLQKHKLLLEKMVDLSVKMRPKRYGFSVLETEAFCVFCGDAAKTPPRVRHKHGCIVAQFQDLANNG